MSTRKLVIVSSIVTLILVVTIVANESAQATRSLELPIQGMHCEGCAASVGASLAKVPGVKDAKVSFDSGVARLTVSRWHGPDAAELRQAVEDAGYKVGGRN
jgi:copper chaperone CopZ